MPLTWLALAIVSTVAYHLVLKLTPATANPFLSLADARRAFDTLADGGQVIMPFQKTFWAEAFGMLVDRFGTPWMVNGAMAST